MNLELTRRNFLAGAATLGAGAAVALASCSAGNASKAGSSADAKADNNGIADSDVKETVDVDIVVAGSGTAGTFAAIRAAEQGAKVMWLEKNSTRGGTSYYTEGISGVGTKEQIASGMDLKKEQLFHDLMDYQSWGAIAETVQAYIDNSGPAIDWAIEHGAQLQYGAVSDDTYWGYVNRTADGNWLEMGVGLLEPLWEYGDTLNTLEHRESTPAVELVMEDGKVAGVYAKGSDGIIRINAKAVILATGGFSGNDDMVAEQLRIPTGRLTFYGLDGRTGDGAVMIEEAGGYIHAPGALMFTFGGVDGTKQFNDIVNAAFAWDALLCVNQTGKRFLDESMALANDTAKRQTALIAQPACWAVADSAYVNAMAAAGPVNYGTGTTVGDLMENIEAYDTIVSADTIEELAEKMGVDAEALAATVKEYNAIANGEGTDTRFQTPAESMVAVAEAPFYAAKLIGTAYSSIGGAATGADFRVWCTDGTPIEHLYAAGCDNGSIYKNNYPMSVMGGTGQGFAATSGFSAADDAVKRYL